MGTGIVTGKEDLPSMHSPPTCSCCIASKSLDELDPWAPWAFTQSNHRLRKKTRNREGLLSCPASLHLLPSSPWDWAALPQSSYPSNVTRRAGLLSVTLAPMNQ